MVKSRSRQLFHPGVCVEDEDSHTAGGFAWKYSPLSECCNDNLFGHVVKTADTVISSQLVDRPPSLLPFPIDGHGQPLFSPESTHSHTDQAPINEVSEEAIFASQNTGSPAVKGNGILHTPNSPRLPQSSSFSPFRRSDPPPSFTSTRLDDGILPTPHFSTRLPSPSSLRRLGSFPTRSGPPQQASSTHVSRLSPSTLGAHPLAFSPLPSPQFSPSSPHLSPVLMPLPIPPASNPCLRFLCHSTLFFFAFVKSHNVLCHFLSWLTSPVTMCLCVGLSSLFLLLPFYFLVRLGSQSEIKEFPL